jgi:hypothetical protein
MFKSFLSLVAASVLASRMGPVLAVNETSAIRSYFYAGGEYINTTLGTLFANQLYVERLSPPAGSTHPYPLVFIHGQAQTGTVRTLARLIHGSYRPAMT